MLLCCAPGANTSRGPSAVTLSGTKTATATVTLNTTTQKAHSGPPPPRAGPIVWLLSKARPNMGALWLVALSLIAAGMLDRQRRTRIGRGWLPLSLRLAGLGAVLCVITAGIGCNNYTYGPNITQSNTGTPTGNYTISIIGILGNNNSVSRTTTVNLSVGPG